MARVSLRVSNFRGLTFVIFATGSGFAIFGHAGWWAWLVAATGLTGFVVLVIRHSRIIELEALEERWVQVNSDAEARVTDGAWHRLPQSGESLHSPRQSYCDDLDIFGKGSLFQRLNVAQTHLGQMQLSQWLTTPADPAEILVRQKTIAILAPHIDLRQELEVLTLASRELSRKGDINAIPEDLEPFVAWAESPRPGDLRIFAWAAWCLPFTSLLGVLLASYGRAPASVVFLPLLVCLWALAQARRRMRPLMQMLRTAERTVATSDKLFTFLEKNAESFGLANRFEDSAQRPSFALSSLSRIGSWFELRHNGLVYPFIDIALLWDIHCWLAFERWRQRHGQRLRRWLDAIGQAEALSSLAGFGFDEPNCCFAEVNDTPGGLQASALGHPLIHPARRVSNDVAELTPGHGLLVTGSNMSGKSTYLRAIGLGCVLGLAGGYVPAERLRLCRLQVATSMRVRDDLASGVSHFYAELQKLKRVIEATREPLPVLFLLDEILHGTNSRERQIGARTIIAEILHAGAFGAVSTHDSALCELSDELSSRMQLVHFRESLTDGEMTFDYLVYRGAVTEGNALRLMHKMGLPVPLGSS